MSPRSASWISCSPNIPVLLPASLSSSLALSFTGCRCEYGWDSEWEFPWEIERWFAWGSWLRWRLSIALTAWISLALSFLISISRPVSRSLSLSLCTSRSHCRSRSISRVLSLSRSLSLSCWRRSSSICSLWRVETHAYTNGVRCNTLDRNKSEYTQWEHAKGVLMMFGTEHEEQASQGGTRLCYVCIYIFSIRLHLKANYSTGYFYQPMCSMGIRTFDLGVVMCFITIWVTYGRLPWHIWYLHLVTSCVLAVQLCIDQVYIFYTKCEHTLFRDTYRHLTPFKLNCSSVWKYASFIITHMRAQNGWMEQPWSSSANCHMLIAIFITLRYF